MDFSRLRQVACAGFILTGVALAQALPVAAVTTGPTVIAVHRDGAVDVPGGAYGTIAKMSVPAGNWSITATATLVGTDTTYSNGCQLVAGIDSYTTGTDPSAQGGGSSQAVVLLLAHHFARAGTISLKCVTSGWTGDVLIRDVHLVAAQVGQLYQGDVTYGTGSPQAYYGQDNSFRQYLDTAQYGIQDMSLPAGTWLVNATLWVGAGSVNSPRITCTLASGNTPQDQTFASVAFYRRTMSLESAFTLAAPAVVHISCSVSTGGWFLYSSAESAIKVGTLKYGQLGGTLSTTGSGSPTVVGGYGGPGGITDATSPASIGALSVGAGSWFVSSKLSVQGGGNIAKVTCQLK